MRLAALPRLEESVFASLPKPEARARLAARGAPAARLRLLPRGGAKGVRPLVNMGRKKRAADARAKAAPGAGAGAGAGAVALEQAFAVLSEERTRRPSVAAPSRRPHPHRIPLRQRG